MTTEMGIDYASIDLPKHTHSVCVCRCRYRSVGIVVGVGVQAVTELSDRRRGSWLVGVKFYPKLKVELSENFMNK